MFREFSLIIVSSNFVIELLIVKTSSTTKIFLFIKVSKGEELLKIFIFGNFSIDFDFVSSGFLRRFIGDSVNSISSLCLFSSILHD